MSDLLCIGFFPKIKLGSLTITFNFKVKKVIIKFLFHRNLWGKRAELACSRPIIGLNHTASLRERLRLRSVPGSRSLEAESRLDFEPEPINWGLPHPWPPGQPGLSPRGQLDLDTEAASAGSEMMRPPWPAEKSMGAWWAWSLSWNE